MSFCTMRSLAQRRRSPWSPLGSLHCCTRTLVRLGALWYPSGGNTHGRMCAHGMQRTGRRACMHGCVGLCVYLCLCVCACAWVYSEWRGRYLMPALINRDAPACQLCGGEKGPEGRRGSLTGAALGRRCPSAPRVVMSASGAKSTRWPTTTCSRRSNSSRSSPVGATHSLWQRRGHRQ